MIEVHGVNSAGEANFPVYPPLTVPLTFASIGDSNVDQNTRWILPPTASPSSAWFSDGFIAKFRSLSKQMINFPLANEKGVSGDKLQDMLARLSQVTSLTPKPDACFVWGGSNNGPTADTLETMFNALLGIVNGLKNSDIIPILYPIPPRGGAVLTQPQIDKIKAYNEDLVEFALNPFNGCLLVDYRDSICDPATRNTTYTPLPNKVKADNLHLANEGGYYVGRDTVAQLTELLPPYIATAIAAEDFYHAVDNPTGSLLHSGATNYSIMAGTTGTHTASSGFTTSGPLATGFTSIRSGGATSTTAVTASKVARFDGLPGEAQRIVIAATTAGATDEIHNLRATPAIGEVAAGEWYYAEVKLKIISAPVNVNAIELYLLETRPTNSQTAIDGGYNSTLSLKLPGETWIEHLKTPPIQRQADATALQVNLRSRLNTASGLAGVTYEVMDYAVRKVAA